MCMTQYVTDMCPRLLYMCVCADEHVDTQVSVRVCVIVPDSSTRVTTSGYVLLILRSPSSILGSSDGLSYNSVNIHTLKHHHTCHTGSTAIFAVETVLNLRGRQICTSSLWSVATMVALLTMEASTPRISTQLPAGAAEISMRYLHLQ